MIAVDIDAAKEKWARQQGASFFLPAKGDEFVSLVHGLSDDIGVDRVIDVVGLQNTMTAGFTSLRRGGRMVVIGYTPERFPLSGLELAQNEKEVIGTRAGRRQDLSRCLKLYESGALTLDRSSVLSARSGQRSAGATAPGRLGPYRFDLYD